MPWFSNNKSNCSWNRYIAEKHRRTMFHTTAVRPKRSGPSILYNTPLKTHFATMKVFYFSHFICKFLYLIYYTCSCSIFLMLLTFAIRPFSLYVIVVKLKTPLTWLRSKFCFSYQITYKKDSTRLRNRRNFVMLGNIYFFINLLHNFISLDSCIDSQGIY